MKVAHVILFLTGLAAVLPASVRAADPFAAPQTEAEVFRCGSLLVEKYGSGPAIVLIPGLSTGAWVWHPMTDSLAETRTVYLVTLPGFSGNAPLAEGSYFAAAGADLRSLLRERNLDRPVLVGHSLGGMLALALAEENPGLFSGLVLVDALPVFPQLAYASPGERKSFAAQSAARVASMDPASFSASFFPYMNSIGTMNPDLAAAAARRQAESDPRAVAAWTGELLERDLRADLPKAALPILEIVPYNPADTEPPRAYTREQTLAFYQSLFAGAPEVSFVVVAPARHFAMLDRPEETLAAIRGFLDELSHSSGK
jgi:pimeloyl-ACP methyl ester carboxylesterase